MTPEARGRSRSFTGAGMRVGRLFGVELYLDLSLLIILALVGVSLAVGVFPAWHPEWGPALVWGVAAMAAMLFVASVLAHEMSHALVAKAHGIPIAGITLFVFGGMTHMEDEPRTPRAEFLVAIVGPLTSLALGVGSFALGTWLARDAFTTAAADPASALRGASPLATLLLWLGPINVILGLFNLVPGFPLDGGRVLRAVLWGMTGDLRRATRWAAFGGQVVAWTLMGAGVAMALGAQVPLLGGGGAQGLWLVLIGWFLNNAARASYEQLVVRESLNNVHVADVMRVHPLVVPPDLDLRTFVLRHAMDTDQNTFPVVEGDALLGVVDVRAVRRIPEEAWPRTSVREVMTAAGELPVMAPDDEAMEALRNLALRQVDQLPVVEDGHLRGVVRQQDIMRWLYLHGGRAPA